MDGLIAYALSKKYTDGKTSSIATGMSWKGTKENVSSLPQSGNQIGDLWHVNEDGNEYAWDGSKWEVLGGRKELPIISSTDNGKFLRVVNGAWAASVPFQTPRVAMAAQDTTPALNPNTFYVFPEMASLTLSLATPSDATIVNEYHFCFDSGATATVLTLPASILQPDGFTVEANMHYEISILEGAMTAQGWAVSA